MESPTSRSLKELRKRGYHAQVTEHWNSFAKIRQDLFGGIDIVAIKGNENGVWGIQATSTPNIASRIAKLSQIQAIRAWVCAGNRLSVWGWAKRGLRGQMKHWELKEVSLGLDDLDAIPE